MSCRPDISEASDASVFKYEALLLCLLVLTMILRKCQSHIHDSQNP